MSTKMITTEGSFVRKPTFTDPVKTPYLNLQLTFSPSTVNPLEWGTAERSFSLYPSSFDNLDPSEVPENLDGTIVAIIEDLAKLCTMRAWQAEISLFAKKSIDLKSDMRETLKLGTDLLIDRERSIELSSWGLYVSTVTPHGPPPGRAWLGEEEDVKAAFQKIREDTDNFNALSTVYDSLKTAIAQARAKQQMGAIQLSMTGNITPEQAASSSPLSREGSEQIIESLLARRLRDQETNVISGHSDESADD